MVDLLELYKLCRPVVLDLIESDKKRNFAELAKLVDLDAEMKDEEVKSKATNIYDGKAEQKEVAKALDTVSKSCHI